MSCTVYIQRTRTRSDRLCISHSYELRSGPTVQTTSDQRVPFRPLSEIYNSLRSVGWSAWPCTNQMWSVPGHTNFVPTRQWPYTDQKWRIGDCLPTSLSRHSFLECSKYFICPNRPSTTSAGRQWSWQQLHTDLPQTYHWPAILPQIEWSVGGRRKVGPELNSMQRDDWLVWMYYTNFEQICWSTPTFTIEINGLHTVQAKRDNPGCLPLNAMWGLIKVNTLLCLKIS